MQFVVSKICGFVKLPICQIYGDPDKDSRMLFWFLLITEVVRHDKNALTLHFSIISLYIHTHKAEFEQKMADVGKVQ